jgi:hypothetical protein
MEHRPFRRHASQARKAIDPALILNLIRP